MNPSFNPDDKHPFETRKPLQDYFQKTLDTVMGQALNAAGYTLLDEPMKWLGGRFRYAKPLDDDFTAYIEFQVLVYNNNAWVAGQPSRFQVHLIRSNKPGGRVSQHARYIRRNLSALVVDDFDVAILPSANHWWQFDDQQTLGQALVEAGQLIVGYGLPWLAGELSPDDPAPPDDS
jgi:hypothetical protein